MVPLDPALPVGEQRARSEAAGARVVLVDGDVPGDDAGTGLAVVADRGDRRPRRCGAAVGPPGRRRRAEATTFRRREGLRDDDAMIMFTGGTTGVPKMVPWTHANIANSVRAIIAGYRLGPQDATVAVMPLYHGHGLIAALLSTLASGGTVLLPARGRFSAHTFWDDIDAVAGHLVHRGADDSPDPVGARQD